MELTCPHALESAALKNVELSTFFNALCFLTQKWSKKIILSFFRKISTRKNRNLKHFCIPSSEIRFSVEKSIFNRYFWKIALTHAFSRNFFFAIFLPKKPIIKLKKNTFTFRVFFLQQLLFSSAKHIFLVVALKNVER